MPPSNMSALTLKISHYCLPESMPKEAKEARAEKLDTLLLTWQFLQHLLWTPSSPVEVDCMCKGKHDYWCHIPGQTSYLKTEVKHSFQEQIQTIKLPI